MIDLKRMLDLLGGHVLRRAHDLAGAGQGVIVRSFAWRSHPDPLPVG